MDTAAQVRLPWNKGLIVGQKRPLLTRQVWSIRVRLKMSGSPRDLALFNLAIDSKLRASDLVRLKTEDIFSGALVRDRGIVIQLKTGRPVQFEITEVTRQSVERLLASRQTDDTGYLFRFGDTGGRTFLPGSTLASSTAGLATSGLNDRGFGTHSLRRTKVAQLYRKIGNLRAVQLLLGHAKIETTVRYSAWKCTTRFGSRSRSNSESWRETKGRFRSRSGLLTAVWSFEPAVSHFARHLSSLAASEGAGLGSRHDLYQSCNTGR